MNNVTVNIAEVRRNLIVSLSGLYNDNEAASVSRIILEHFGIRQYDLLSTPTLTVDPEIRSEIKKIVTELHKNRPVQYVLGATEFHELSFLVDENVLIPRPETEELVSNILHETNKKSPTIMDIGTGSGCIAIALAHKLKGSKVKAIEKDTGALDIAKKNADINKVKVGFIVGDILKTSEIKINDMFDLIVSNPPYVTMSEKEVMEKRVTDHEPEKALYVPDADPLKFYRAIISFAEERLHSSGAVWVEINENFGKQTKELFEQSSFKNIKLMKDLHGKDRFIKAIRKYV